MIILFSHSIINQNAANILNKHSHNLGHAILFSEVKLNKTPTSHSSNCYIVNLDESPFISAKDLAEALLPVFAHNSISNLYLIMPENIHNPTPIAFYATQLAKLLNKNLTSKIVVHTISDNNYDQTIIEPVLEKNSWQVYGLNFSENKQLKTLLWEGKDLHEWLNHPQRSFSGLTYVWAG